MHISGGIPLLGPITPLLGRATPLFGGARLPNSLEANNSGDGFCDDKGRPPRLTRRAVGTRTMHLLRDDILQGMLTSSRFFDHSGLMTNTKIFVSCLKPFPVSL
jgi:hypothetical protein